MMRSPGLVLLAVLLSCSRVFGEERFPFVGEVSAKEVNVRAGQSVNFEQINRLKKGDQVLVLGKEFSWYKVQLPADSRCFIHSKYLQLKDGRTGIVTADKVNLRAAGDFNASVLAQVPKDTVLTVFGKKEDWYQVQPPQKATGWIAAEFVAFRSADLASLTQLVHPPLALPNLAAPETTPAPAVAAVEKSNMFTATGTLEKSTDGQRYKLVTSTDARYFLEAPESVLKDFLHQRIKVEGNKKINQQFPSMYPVLMIEQVELVL